MLPLPQRSSIPGPSRHREILQVDRLNCWGEQVAVSDGGRVNVSGGTGGGEVVINSDQQTTIEQGALISADALGSGNGGSVSVLSSGTTEFYRSISAVGAGSAGVGGSAEVPDRNFIFPATPT